VGKYTVTVFVGDGFIRPEITSLCVNGRYLPRITKRAYLGTDKSVPYKKHASPYNKRNILICVSFLLCPAPSVPLCENSF